MFKLTIDRSMAVRFRLAMLSLAGLVSDFGLLIAILLLFLFYLCTNIPILSMAIKIADYNVVFRELKYNVS